MIFTSLVFALSSIPFIRAQITAAYYAGWHSDDYPLSDVHWEKYTAMAYAFAETTDDVHSLSFNGSNPELVPQFVAAAKENGVKALVSIGGWSGSRFFSTAVDSAENRTAFVDTVTKFATEHQVDGLDFDWEYPNKEGLSCNSINVDDTANYLAFLQELRAHPIGSQLLITAATSISPFSDSAGSPSTDVSAFGEVFDYIVLMNYDLWGSWSTSVGPNGALDDTCATTERQQGSAVNAVKAWTDAGFPKEKLVLGLPAYGHSFSVASNDALPNGTDTLALYPPFNAEEHPAGDDWDDKAGTDICGAEANAAGVVQFWGLIEQGYLDQSGNVVDGIPYVYDNCSQTPFIYNTSTNVLISFDNAESFHAKGKWVKDSGIAGFAIWEAGGDYNDVLLDSARAGLGANSTQNSTQNR